MRSRRWERRSPRTSCARCGGWRPSRCCAWTATAPAAPPAARAAERALPLLAPGRSLAFAFLPEGEDPDSLVARAGAAGMRARLADAVPLVEVLWRGLTAGRSAATPERRAALRQEIDRTVAGIADGRVRADYARAFRERFDAAYRPPRRRAAAGAARRAFLQEEPAAPPDEGARRERTMLAALLTHPRLIPDLAEELAEVEIRAGGLRRLRDVLVDFAASAEEDAGPEALRAALEAAGALDYAGALLASGRWDGGQLAESFARAGAPDEAAREGFLQSRPAPPPRRAGGRPEGGGGGAVGAHGRRSACASGPVAASIGFGGSGRMGGFRPGGVGAGRRRGGGCFAAPPHYLYRPPLGSAPRWNGRTVPNVEANRGGRGPPARARTPAMRRSSTPPAPPSSG